MLLVLLVLGLMLLMVLVMGLVLVLELLVVLMLVLGPMLMLVLMPHVILESELLVEGNCGYLWGVAVVGLVLGRVGLVLLELLGLLPAILPQGSA
jgi:hypothetical protein